MSERLCLICQPYGKCLFREYVDGVVAEIKAKGFSDQELLKSAAIEVHQKITEGRIKARKRDCPNLNDIDPDYPGRKML